MVNFRDPSVILQDAVVLSKLWHAVGGLYVWEYFTTLDYEWSVIRGRRPYRWTIWIYSLARVSALLTIIFDFVILDVTAPVNCQATVSVESAFAFLTISASSLLIVLRVIAIWDRNKIVMAVAYCLWGVNAGFFVQFIVRLRVVWIRAVRTCASLNLEESVPNFIAIPVTDIALLLIMLVGLFRLHHGGRFGLARVLRRQGVLWLLLALVFEVPPVVFIILNLNDSFNVMFELPSWITMAIAATRMHRSLVDFASSAIDVDDLSVPGNTPNGNPTGQEKKWISTTSTPTVTDGTELTTHIVTEQSRTPRTREDDSCISTDKHMTMHVKQNALFCDDIERGL